MELYLVRHPQTMRNVNDKLTGWEETEYSKTGKKQFDKIRGYFLNKRGEFKIFSSDLPRALKLARKIAKDKGWELHVSKSLRERNFIETKPFHSFETKKEFEKRIESFLKKNNIKNSIIISHSGTTRIILKKIMSENEDCKMVSCRYVLYKIETIKNKKIFKKVQL